jgi:integrase/recombinase XerD
MQGSVKRTEKSENIKDVYVEFQRKNQLKNLSKYTIWYYANTLRPFFNYLSGVGISSIKQVNRNVIGDYILTLKNRHPNAITVNTHIRAVRAFMYFGMDNGYLPYFKIYTLKQPEKVMQTYSDADVKKLIARPNLKTCSFVTYRNWVMVNYFLETGNRLRSALNIRVGDVHFPERRITIRATKNRAEIETPITKTLQSILPPYISAWGLRDSMYLFPSVKGTQITRNAAEQAIHNYNLSRGVKITSIHAFRHTFARNYIVTGGSAFKLQSLLGHKCLEETRHYVHLFGTDLACDIDAHSVIERLKLSQPTYQFKKSNRRR